MKRDLSILTMKDKIKKENKTIIFFLGAENWNPEGTKNRRIKI